MNIYPSQSAWDQFNQSVSNAMGVPYVPTPYDPTPVVPTVQPPAWNKGMPSPNRGKHVHSEEWKQALSDRMKGNQLGTGKPYVYRDTRSEEWILTDPSGNQHHIRNLKKYCEQHNLDATALRRVARGRCKQYKGWTCIKSPMV
jgi:hypothetical protein